MSNVCEAKKTSRHAPRFLFPRIAVFALVLAWAAASSCNAQPPWMSGRQSSLQFETSRGYLFLNHEYVAPPITVELRGASVVINGEAVAASGFDLTGLPPSEREQDSRFDGSNENRRRFVRYRTARMLSPGRGQGNARSQSQARPLFDLLQHLRAGDVIVMSEAQQPLALSATGEGQDLLGALTATSQSENDEAGIKRSETSSSETLAPETLSSDAERESWNSLVSGFIPSEEFLSRATLQLRQQEEVQESNAAAMTANVWEGRVLYPLTVFAMIMVVLAFGHLLTHQPVRKGGTLSGEPAQDDDSNSERRQMVFRSLLIVGLLSAVDLIWTLLAHRAGSMRELNPLGNHLINDPMHLTLFKFAAVAVAISLLARLHRRPIAQAAAWWSCLMLTLVTARWLTFNAMFL